LSWLKLIEIYAGYRFESEKKVLDLCYT
jgi:hypothetical protein